ncbi:sensor histidine kinase [Limosilactobacillus fastidiosus]|uniref:histidine kinase n=1 Tax=Limosilactobacillus fastidiosus TaxID=2759855 RepID=A0A7W3YC10_9LACO|nr:HAMP domain-containing sensor histidine kinase [Limosilactobacillus fastidiosus]MBB1062458.1 HAMP domain-containing histidine kinase [Limosilactobacillus fastidiosus]MBB1085591.1 HAMP domain-containing histidine kinase [Limosilactobacillus fastidiosus]MCD7083532.1 HAMP domain-containing histidine kinase [Limosilactobacillus fastidiosus]MCD7086044.1 HAMP domain-containing histidine kinase [Limosilactobacillus fastidiosus]MCD7114312.1 HAMP domain-containing histidine kinase [Limosilactobacill
MIRHFRKQFIIFSTCALLLVIITIVGSISSVTYFRAHQEVNAVLTILSNNDGEMPARMSPDPLQAFTQPNITRESLSQYRYFSGTLNKQNNQIKVEDDHILSVSPAEIQKLTQRVLRGHRLQGRVFYKQTVYAYRVKDSSKQTNVVFLDETLMLSKALEVTYLGILLGIVSLLLYATVLVLFSKSAIRPIVQAEQRQKEFITNAGHELKTPLSVISANTEMQELMNGENDLTRSTKEQVDRLTKLINQFVSLARLQEQPRMTLSVINASRVTNQVADSFKSVVVQDGKKFKAFVTPKLMIKADEHYFYELISILLDNANKYCDPEGDVYLKLRLGKRRKNVILSVTNSFAAGKEIDYQRFFERFYREDKARTINEKKSGYGIGLSMAQNIVKNFGGQIKISYSNGKISMIITIKKANHKLNGKQEEK